MTVDYPKILLGSPSAEPWWGRYQPYDVSDFSVRSRAVPVENTVCLTCSQVELGCYLEVGMYLWLDVGLLLLRSQVDLPWTLLIQRRWRFRNSLWSGVGVIWGDPCLTHALILFHDIWQSAPFPPLLRFFRQWGKITFFWIRCREKESCRKATPLELHMQGSGSGLETLLKLSAAKLSDARCQKRCKTGNKIKRHIHKACHT